MFSIDGLSDEELCQLAVEQVLTTKSGDKWKVQDLFPKTQRKQVLLDVRMRVGGVIYSHYTREHKGIIKELPKNSQNQQMWETIASEAELDRLRGGLK